MSVVTYYNLAYSKKTKITPRQRYQHDTMRDGSVRGRDMAGGDVYDATIVHEYISEADADGLHQHYLDNQTNIVQFQHGSAVYNLKYVGAPQIRVITDVYHEATVTMVGTRYE